MTRLSERTVQVHAQEFLEIRCRRKARRGKIFSQLEVRTKRKYGNKRADGLIAFKHWLSGTYVVSLEAKSSKTLPAMDPKTEVGRLVWNSFLAGLVICLLTGAFVAFYKMDDGLNQFLLPLNVFGVGALAYGFLTRDHFSHKTVSVVKQIGQYPANEQWLAFSEDSFRGLDPEKAKSLTAICRYRGIGILVVKPRGKVETLLKAKLKRKWFGDFLKYYSLEKEIKKAIR